MAALLFLPAGTLNYWQGWVFFALFFVASNAIGVYLAIYNPVLLERRMSVGYGGKRDISKNYYPFCVTWIHSSFGFSCARPPFRMVSSSSVCIRCRRYTRVAWIFTHLCC